MQGGTKCQEESGCHDSLEYKWKCKSFGMEYHALGNVCKGEPRAKRNMLASQSSGRQRWLEAGEERSARWVGNLAHCFSSYTLTTVRFFCVYLVDGYFLLFYYCISHFFFILFFFSTISFSFFLLIPVIIIIIIVILF